VRSREDTFQNGRITPTLARKILDRCDVVLARWKIDENVALRLHCGDR
jgi:hypothetical protein